MKRFIFDLDGTLLTNGFKKEHEFFREQLGENAEVFISNTFRYLDDYEHEHYSYDVTDLSKYLSMKSGFEIKESLITGWIDIGITEIDNMEEGVMDTLEYLYLKNKDVIVLTNWFTKTQVSRLKKSNLIDFIDEVHCGDTNLKPHRSTYLTACGEHSPSECIIIGDNVEKDYLEPQKYGLNALLYDKDDKHDKSLKKIKRIDEIKKMF